MPAGYAIVVVVVFPLDESVSMPNLFLITLFLFIHFFLLFSLFSFLFFDRNGKNSLFERIAQRVTRRSRLSTVALFTSASTGQL